MKITFLPALAFLLAAGCASQQPVKPSQLGRFVMAGPVSADGSVASIRWQYGLQLNIDAKTISNVKFTCDPIPGTSFSVKGEELRVLKNGALIAEGPILPISGESTPWLYDKTTTSATCQALIFRSDHQNEVIQAPVNFPASVKTATVQQMKMAHDFNSSATKR